MQTITNGPNRFKLYAAGVTLTALVIAVLAVTFAAGPAWAQTADGTYPDPQPCGPGAQDVPSNPDETITKGHFAVFDGYWDSEKENLNLNLCPPSVVHTMETRENKEGDEIQVEVSTRTKSNVDIQKTVIHIAHIDGVPKAEQFKHVLTAADVEKYEFLKVGDANGDGTDDAVGQTVWWLKVDDESTPDVDEDSPLAMGFSAALFDPDYWFLADADGSAKGAKPLQYEFEVIREPGTPIDKLGHVFAFDDSNPAGDGNLKTAYWDSSEVDANALPLYPGEYHHFQWIFTKPGTYVVSVQLKGHVRTKADPRPAGAAADWKPISDDSVVTSEVGQYVFQIGPLTLNHDPVFTATQRSVKEHAAVGTAVGDPIPVYRGDDDDLTFTLFGTGHELFSVTSTAEGVQIQVAGNVDYETKRSFDLTVGVSDGKDHEGNSDDSIDDTIPVRINVEDLVTYVDLSNANPHAGESVTITVTLDNPPQNMYRGAGGVDMLLTEHGNPYPIAMLIDNGKRQGTATVTKSSAQTAVYTPTISVYILDRTTRGGHNLDIEGPTFSITWQAAE